MLPQEVCSRTYALAPNLLRLICVYLYPMQSTVKSGSDQPHSPNTPHLSQLIFGPLAADIFSDGSKDRRCEGACKAKMESTRQCRSVRFDSSTTKHNQINITHWHKRLL